MTRRSEFTGRENGVELPRRLLDQWEGDWQGKDPVDLTGRPIEPGMWLVKTFQSGRSCNLEIRQVREVRQVHAGKLARVFLDDSRVPIEYPGRCLIVDWDPAREKLSHVDQVD